jgi:hypothetical protein
MQEVPIIKFPLEMNGLKNLYIELIIRDSKSSRSEYDDSLHLKSGSMKRSTRSIDINHF